MLSLANRLRLPVDAAAARASFGVVVYQVCDFGTRIYFLNRLRFLKHLVTLDDCLLQ